MLASPIVPPQPHKQVVFGRPKTRSALRTSSALGVLGILVNTIRPEWPQPAIALLAAAAVAATLAGILRIFERPREFTTHTYVPPLGAPVVHVGDQAGSEVPPKNAT